MHVNCVHLTTLDLDVSPCGESFSVCVCVLCGYGGDVFMDTSGLFAMSCQIERKEVSMKISNPLPHKFEHRSESTSRQQSIVFHEAIARLEIWVLEILKIGCNIDRGQCVRCACDAEPLTIPMLNYSWNNFTRFFIFSAIFDEGRDSELLSNHTSERRGHAVYANTSSANIIYDFVADTIASSADDLSLHLPSLLSSCGLFWFAQKRSVKQQFQWGVETLATKQNSTHFT